MRMIIWGRKTLLASLMLLVAINGMAQKKINDFANFGRYHQSNLEWQAKPNDGKRVVFMGNSITDGWYNIHPDFFKSHGFIGRGISGQTSYQMVLRFHEDVIGIGAKVVVINCCTNDIAQNNHEYVEDRSFQNVVTMCEMAKAYKVKVVLTSITPCAGYRWNTDITDVVAKITHFNARVQEYAKKHKIPYVDYFAAMSNEQGGMRDGLHQGDGCHPNAAGYDVMEPLVLEAIRKYVK